MKHLTIMSKRSLLLVTAIILLAGTIAHAQTEAPQTDEIWRHKFAIGIGPEINMHSPEGYAGGLSLNFVYNLPFPNLATSFALGLSFTGSNNFDGITVLEPSAFFRWYFLNSYHRGLFAQVNVGGNFILL